MKMKRGNKKININRTTNRVKQTGNQEYLSCPHIRYHCPDSIEIKAKLKSGKVIVDVNICLTADGNKIASHLHSQCHQ
jgi:hypothetical protein